MDRGGAGETGAPDGESELPAPHGRRDRGRERRRAGERKIAFFVYAVAAASQRREITKLGELIWPAERVTLRPRANRDTQQHQSADQTHYVVLLRVVHDAPQGASLGRTG